MESLYYVISWACHRRCKHCYEEKFRPYVRDELAEVVDEAKTAFPKVIANLPDDFTYLDLNAPRDDLAEGYERKAGRIIIAGGEVLIDPVREEILYPALELIQEKWRGLGVKVLVQTTGDLVTPKIVDELLARGVWMISISGMDDFHVGHEGEKRKPIMKKLVDMFEAAGMADANRSTVTDGAKSGNDGPVYSFFGATEDEWIGKIWPRGRAWENGLSRAKITDNFCNAWSGGLNFLNRGYSGAEVSIDPNGDVFPCCLKTKAPIGNLQEEPLYDILDSLAGHPVFEAISMGHPERMGVSHGWDVAKFLDKSRTETPFGVPYRNLCIGCDKFHEEVLSPVLDELRDRRRAARLAEAAE